MRKKCLLQKSHIMSDLRIQSRMICRFRFGRDRNWRFLSLISTHRQYWIRKIVMAREDFYVFIENWSDILGLFDSQVVGIDSWDQPTKNRSIEEHQFLIFKFLEKILIIKKVSFSRADFYNPAYNRTTVGATILLF